MPLLEARVRLHRGGSIDFSTRERHSALHGPSGIGKSTLLRVIAGHEPSIGFVRFNGVVFQDDRNGVFIPSHQRRIGWVPQDALLFPHLSVRSNLLFGRDACPAELPSIVEQLEIGHLLGRTPATLSGGERQRVALGRALLSDPALLLMDEAFSALHRNLKAPLLERVSKYCARHEISTLMVTHQIEDATWFGCPGFEWSEERENPSVSAPHAILRTTFP